MARVVGDRTQFCFSALLWDQSGSITSNMLLSAETPLTMGGVPVLTSHGQKHRHASVHTQCTYSHTHPNINICACLEGIFMRHTKMKACMHTATCVVVLFTAAHNCTITQVQNTVFDHSKCLFKIPSTCTLQNASGGTGMSKNQHIKVQRKQIRHMISAFSLKYV